MQERVCVPVALLALHSTTQFDQALQPPSMLGHCCSLQSLNFRPAHLVPPNRGDGLVQERGIKPGPHVVEHGPQDVQPPFLRYRAQGTLLQARWRIPVHARPPCAGLGIVQLRTCTPGRALP